MASYFSKNIAQSDQIFIYIRVLDAHHYYSAWGNTPTQAKIKVMRMLAWDRKNGLIPSQGLDIGCLEGVSLVG